MYRNTTIPQSASLTAPFTQGGLIIGITGGTGCGKTTLLNVIAEKGGLILDCDAVYHQLLTRDDALLNAIGQRAKADPDCDRDLVQHADRQPAEL